MRKFFLLLLGLLILLVRQGQTGPEMPPAERSAPSSIAR
jgi:hypothetical protein